MEFKPQINSQFYKCGFFFQIFYLILFSVEFLSIQFYTNFTEFTQRIFDSMKRDKKQVQWNLY